LLLEVFENGVNVVEGFVNLLPDFGSRQNNLSGDENEENDLRFDHAVNETWKEEMLRV